MNELNPSRIALEAQALEYHRDQLVRSREIRRSRAATRARRRDRSRYEV